MATPVRWGRLLRIAGIALLTPLLCLAAYVPIQQRILRWRAERLLADIHAIQMGKSTWADAQRLMYRWGKWGKWEGVCNTSECDYQIVLQDISHANPTYFLGKSELETRSKGYEYWRWQLHLYSILGGRMAQIYASIHVKNGIVWTKGFAVKTPRHTSKEGVGDLLIGGAEGTTRFSENADWPMLTTHPEHSIWASGPCAGCRGACTICELIQADVTPFEDLGITNQLFDFNLACITQWQECEEPREIMPAAWRLYRQEREAIEKSPNHTDASDWERCNLPVATIGRDYRFALLTEVVSIKTSLDSGLTRYVVRLRGLKSLKNGASFGSEILRDPLVGWSSTILPGNLQMAQIKPRSHIVYLFDRPLADRWDVVPGSDGYCSYVLDTAENRAALQRGFALDALSNIP